MSRLALCFVIICVVSIEVNSQSPCKTNSGIDGICINLQQCEPVFNVLKKAPKPLSKFLVNTIRGLHCGPNPNDSKICCVGGKPSQSTSTPTKSPPTPTATSCSMPDVTRHRNLRLLDSECGLQTVDKISNGQETALYEFPWMALLRYNTANGVEHLCGGTIINQRYILTAAHCITGLVNSTLTEVRVGEHDTETDTDCEGPARNRYCAPAVQDIPIQQIISHPNFVNIVDRNLARKTQNDIALIRLSRNIEFTPMSIGSICLPTTPETQNFDLTNQVLELSGWGFTEQGYQSTKKLAARLSSIPTDECADSLTDAIKGGILCSQFCAAGPKGTNSCPGDSGGPLKVLQSYNGVVRYVQHGIVSLGPRRCGIYNAPAIYTKVALYMKWILDQLRP